MDKPYVIGFDEYGDRVVVNYSDGDKVTVARADYVRAVGTIINADKEDVKRDFAIKEA